MQTLTQQALLNRSTNNTVALFSLNNEQVTNEMKKIARIWIDGEIIGGYLVYSALDVKSYAEEPVRSTSGVIENLNAYTTFLTPTVTLEFKYMPIQTYRTIIRLIQARNEHIVKYYDIVADKFVTRKMYFKPEQMPELFSKRYEVLAVLNYKLELVGTNSNLNLITISYNPNPPEGVTTSQTALGSNDQYLNGEEVIIGADANAETIYNLADIIDAGYKFKNWNTEPDGTGIKYINNQVYTLNVDDEEVEAGVLNLYAQWESSSEWTLSYSYGIGAIATDSNGQQILSRKITLGSTYVSATNNAFPETYPNDITFLNVTYSGSDIYTRLGWYKTPTIGLVQVLGEDGNPVVNENGEFVYENASPLTKDDKYNVKANTTIYQLFEPKERTITLDTRGATNPENGYSPITNKYGTLIYAPQNPTKDGYTFNGWWIQGSGETEDKDVQFMFGTMPPTNIIIYAKWIEKED